MSKETSSPMASEEEKIKERFQQEKDICSMYVDCSKSYVQLSTGALLLTLTFYKDIIGLKEEALKNNPLLICIWFLWLFTIVAGVTYQYSVTKYLEDIANHYKLLEYERSWSWYFFRIFRQEPYKIYGVMIISFYAALIIFFGLALFTILHK